MILPRFAALLVVALPAYLQGQMVHRAHDGAMGTRDSLSAMLTAVTTRVSPAIAGRDRTEALLTQPMVMLRGARASGALQYAIMLNAEHWTMPGGEPVAGIWGEGFIDRRHPHTVLHEVMVSGQRRLGRVRASLAAGKGIVPFGTDDPMVRPFTKYPANHHFSQLLERVQVAAALRLGERIAIETALFNGDEPAGPTAPPRWSRFADSRAARMSLWPGDGIELQASGAFVRSPEFASGAGLDQQKTSASGRWTPASGSLRYVLVEWARTAERYRGRDVVDYGTVLAEAMAARGALSMAIRLERTSRPEEERLLDLFRTARPPNELTIRGVTRWHLATAQVAAELPTVARLHGSVFAEATHARSAPLLRPVLLDPADVIGANAAWHLSVGARVGVGRMPMRVGRYGVAAGGPRTDAALSMPHH